MVHLVFLEQPVHLVDLELMEHLVEVVLMELLVEVVQPVLPVFLEPLDHLDLQILYLEPLVLQLRVVLLVQQEQQLDQHHI
jgi:hypothetical protein